MDTTATKPVVTIWETYGSRMSEVAAAVAAAMGAPLHAQAFSTEEIEEAMQERESEGILSRLLRPWATALNPLDEPGVAIPSMIASDRAETVRKVRAEVAGFAHEGGVILGRNATVILSSRPNTLHVKLDGPVSARVAAAAAVSGVSIERSAARQKAEDSFRAETSIDHFHWDPRGNDAFDVVVNTATLGVQGSVQVILSALHAKQATS